MTRQLFFAITLIGTGVLLNSPAVAQEWQCEDKAANCLGGCIDKVGGAGDDWRGHQSKCLRCDRQLIKCVRNAIMRRHSSY
jgi:hypothetical protein